MTVRFRTIADVLYSMAKTIKMTFTSTTRPPSGFGARVVLDQVLTIALSFVFLHHGLGLEG